MKSLVTLLLGITMCGVLSGCRKLCEEDAPNAVSIINRDGAKIYTVSGNCTALDNFVTFYFESPRSGKVALAKADSVEYAGMHFDKSTGTIFILVPDPKEASARQSIEKYRVRALSLQAHNAEERALFDKWSSNPNDPEAVQWIEEQVRRRHIGR
jgi:hypothetical protein